MWMCGCGLGGKAAALNAIEAIAGSKNFSTKDTKGAKAAALKAIEAIAGKEDLFSMMSWWFARKPFFDFLLSMCNAP